MLLVPQEYILKAGAKVKITPTAISACDYDGYYRYAPVALSTADGAAPILGGRGSVYGGKTSLQWSKNRTIRSRYPKFRQRICLSGS